MKTEDKELLIKDISARIPYYLQVEIKAKIPFINIIYSIDIDGSCEINEDLYNIDKIKPYLFPLSSMTEEQKKEFNSFIIKAPWKLIDWFNKNHFDYRELISMGLANDATGLNIY